MRAVLFGLMMVSSLTVSAQARSLADIQASGVLRLATSADYEPFNFMKGDTFGGFEVELGNNLAEQLGVKPVWIKDDFDALLTDFKVKNYDVVIAAHAITSTRAKIVDFTNPHSCGGNVLLAKAGGPLTSKDLVGKTLGAESGSINLGFLQKLPFKKQVKVYSSSGATYQAVALGEVDAALTDKLGALKAIKTYSKANLVMGDVLWSTQSGMAVEKGNVTLRRGLNTALAALLRNGTYAKLSQQYFGTRYSLRRYSRHL